LLAFDIHDVGVAAASAADTILLDWVRGGPILIFFNALLLIIGGLFKVRFAGKLSSGGVGRAMLNGRVTVSEVTEVVDVTWGKKSTGSKGMNRSITPL
jgi:hypothetical protein